MLDEIKFIQNIGRFEKAQNNKATFRQCTLMFGENGWGKSTLADILRSLTTNNAAILVGRKTLTATAESKAVLRFGTATTQFADGAWTGPRPRIAIYDTTFINDNVCSGDMVSAEHLKKQFGLVVGEKGVQLVRRLVDLDGVNRDNNSALATTQAELNGIHRSVAPGMTVEAFLALMPRPDIEQAITHLNGTLNTLRRGKELKAATEPALLLLPADTRSLHDLLGQTVDGIAEAAAARIRTHIAIHEGKPDKAGMVHESWLEAGHPFVKTDNCPFCGQKLADRTLIDAYKDFFSEAYKALAASIKKTRDTFARYGTGEFKTTVATLHAQNTAHIQFWQEAAQLAPPQLPAINPVIGDMENAAADLDKVFAAKQANLIQALTDGSAQAALGKWDAARSNIAAFNQRLAAFQASIKALKDSIDVSKLPQLEKDAGLLQAIKRRHQSDVTDLVAKMEVLKKKKEAIAVEKDYVRTALNDHGRAITDGMGKAINAYLKSLAAGFKIDYREPDYRSKEPTATYNILINDVPVSPRAEEIDKPSFRNTLSAGDKSILAFAVFLAKLNTDPYLNETIVVLDDPFTSLDNSRRQFMASEIRKLCGRAKQVIIMSHEKNFLRLLWDKIDQATISPVALQTGAPGMATFVPYNIATATQPRHITERIQIEEFLEGEGDHSPQFIRTRLRTVSEDFYRKGDPALFGEAASLEEIIRKLDEAASDHPYKGALEDLRDINEYSRGDNHAAVGGNPAEETTVDELKEFCRRVLSLTRGM